MKTINYAIATLAVAVVLVGVVVPMVAAYEDGVTYTYTNTGTNVVTGEYLDLSEDTVINVYLPGDNTCYMTIDGGDQLPLSLFTVPIISDALNIRPYSTSFGLNYVGGKVSNVYYYDADTKLAMSVSISNGQAIITYGTSTHSAVSLDAIPISWLAYQKSDGDLSLCMSEATSKVMYYTDITQIRGANWISTTSEWFTFIGDSVKVGDDEITATISNVQTLDGDGQSFVYSNTVGDYTFTVDNNGEDYTVHPYVFVAPKTVNAITEHDSLLVSLVSMLPVLIAVGVVLFVVGTYAANRRA